MGALLEPDKPGHRLETPGPRQQEEGNSMARPTPRAILALGGAAALATSVALGPLATAAQPASATGHGFYNVGTDDSPIKRQFSFNAIQVTGDVAKGNAEV